MTVFQGFTPPSKVVELASGSGSFPVTCYGLGLDDIMSLARDYASHLTPLYEAAASGSLRHDLLFEKVVDLIEEIPPLVNLTVLLGTKSDADQLEIIGDLSIGAKIELLEAIVELTLRSENGSGKVVEIVKRAFMETGLAMRLPRST
jgi:hypothetical protein